MPSATQSKTVQFQLARLTMGLSVLQVACGRAELGWARFE